MYKIGVIGDKDSVLGFMAVGFSVTVVSDTAEARNVLNAMAKTEEYAAIFITEQLASELNSEIEKYRDRSLPAIIAIPSKEGSKGYGIQSIRKSVENAIGADILFKNT